MKDVKKPAIKIDIPPIFGISPLCTFRRLGLSKSEALIAKGLNNKVKTIVNIAPKIRV